MIDPEFIPVPDHPLIQLNNKPAQQVCLEIWLHFHISCVWYAGGWFLCGIYKARKSSIRDNFLIHFLFRNIYNILLPLLLLLQVMMMLLFGRPVTPCQFACRVGHALSLRFLRSGWLIKKNTLRRSDIFRYTLTFYHLPITGRAAAVGRPPQYLHGVCILGNSISL